MPRGFKISLEIKRNDSNEHVYHKIDGQRFGHTNTVKLNVNTEYNVRVTLRPAMRLLRLVIHGERRDAESVKGKNDDEKCTYIATFCTDGYQHSKKGNRKEVPFVFELEDGLSMQTKLQCKFYNRNETEHSKWGNKLTSIEHDCHVTDGYTFVNVTKEKYL